MPAAIVFTNELIEAICSRIASGEAITSIVRDKAMPAVSTIYGEMAKNEDFRNRIARARESQQDFEADHCVTLADNATVEDHQVVKLRIWARQWRAAKLAPKKYGDKQIVEQTTEITHKGPEYDLSALSAEDRGRMRELLLKAKVSAAPTLIEDKNRG